MSLFAGNAAVWLSFAALSIGDLDYAEKSEHGKIFSSMTRATDRAVDRVNELI